MPNSIVKSFVDKTGKSVAEVEDLWNQAKKAAKDAGKSESDDTFYPYVTGVLKKMLKINESSDVVADTLAYLDKLKRTGYLNEGHQGPILTDHMHMVLSQHPVISHLGGRPTATLIFYFKDHPVQYYIYSHDGWFRKEKGFIGEGYGIAFKSITRLGKPQDMGNGFIKQNIKFTYLPSQHDVDDPKFYETDTGSLLINNDTLISDKGLYDVNTGMIDTNKVVDWLARQAKANVWFP